MTPSDLQNIKDALSSIDSITFIGLAGGAPRDLYLDRTPKDWDIYVSGYLQPSHLLQAGFADIDHRDISSYGNLGYVQNIYYCKYKDNEAKLNIIVVDELYDILTLVNKFSCSLSKCYYDFAINQIVTTKAFRLSVATNTITFNEDVSDRYYAKITSYFPYYDVVTTNQLINRLIEEAISYHPSTKALPVILATSTSHFSTTSIPFSTYYIEASRTNLHNNLYDRNPFT